ncbi:MAG TPA: glycoside hydrolase family 19 protein [Geobacteraceae bacterium]|nr:glycoside hydrolase family 19 protein [Geobacteraceae bacterium]
MCITASVGLNGKNSRPDVKTVQILINMNIGKLAPLDELAEDGIFGDATTNAIEAFQRMVIGMPQPDSRVDPGGQTLNKMAEGILSFCHKVLKGIFINADDSLITRYCDAFAGKMVAYSINTPLRMAHFLAQVGHESGELRYCEEIASGDAYEGRKDLGNTQPGDGRRFKGRGLIQLTGRANYIAYGKARGIDYTTDQGAKLLADDPETAVDVACWFWTTHNLNAFADKDDIITITKRINGGLNGLDNRKANLERTKFFIPQA